MRSNKLRLTVVTAVMMVVMLLSVTVASAATDPYVTIINPGKNATVVSNSLLISIKVTQPRQLNIDVYQEGTNSRTLKMSDTFTCDNNLSFYTKRLDSLSPGAYRVHVETVNSNGAVIFSTDQYVAMKATDSDNSEVVVFSSSTTNIIQKMLKYVFG